MALLPSPTLYPSSTLYPGADPGGSGGGSGSGTGSVRRNLSPNPALKNNTTGNGTDWTSSPSGYARQTGVTGMDRTTGFGGSGARDIITTPRFAAVAGQQYVCSVQVKTGASNTFKMLINWYTGTASGSSFLSNSGTSVQFTVTGTQRCEIGPYTAPVGAGAGYLRIIEVDNTTATFTALLAEQVVTTGNSYFDGDTTGATWDGTAGNSTSQLLTGTDPITWADSGSVQSVAPGPTGSDAATFTASGAGVASGTVNEDVTWSEGGLIVGLTYDGRRGRIRVDAIGLPATAIRAVVSRKISGSKYTTVRGGKVAVQSGRLLRNVDDYEFVSGQDNTYRVQAFSTPEGVADAVVGQAIVTAAPVLDEVWLKFIASPVFNRRVQLIDWGDISRPSRAAFYDVQGRTDPIAVLDVAGSRRVTVTLRTSTKAEGRDLDYALSQGMPLFLHVPESVALDSMYAAAGDITWTRPSKLTQVCYWQIPLTEVSAPPASIVGAASTWQSVLDGYDSWADVLDGFADWREVAS